MGRVLRHSDTDEIEGLLLGHTVTVVGEDTATLNDGTQLKFVGNHGCGGCLNGNYELTALNGMDNVITRVEFLGDPDDDDGIYEIFVYTAHNVINLASFEGNDGNGCYGTGYTIHVTKPLERK